MTRHIGWRDLIAISVYAFALSFLWNSWGVAVLPRQVGLLVPDAQKNTFLGLAQFVGLFIALVVQPLAGAVSDRYQSRWGRRRPFIVLGTVGDLVAFTLFGLAGSYWMLLAAYALLQITSNIAHGPYQGLIPDLVPHDYQGRASGMKSVAELLAAIATSLVMGQLLDRGLVWLALSTFGLVLVSAATLTALLVHEEPSVGSGALVTVPGVGDMAAAFTRSTDFAWYVISRLFMLLGLAGVRNYAYNFLTDVIRVDQPAQMTLLMQLILAVCVLLVSLPVGYMADRVGRKPLNYAAGIIGAAGAILLTQAHTFPEVILYGTLVGISLGIFFTANWALAISIIPPAEAALFLGLTNIATAGSGALSGAFGPFIDIMKVMFPGQGYTMLFLVAALCYLIGTAFLIPVQERRMALGPQQAA